VNIKKMNGMIKQQEQRDSAKDRCPQCGSDTGIKVVNTNNTSAGVDIYCEDCGWPDENRG
jgi:predicted RNA-binding Zn-ribbon protein involved in translation (DUF1610 family)